VKEGLLRSLRAALAFNPRGYLPMNLSGHRVGWVRLGHAGRLQAWPELFRISNQEIQVTPAEEPALSSAFAKVADALAREGVVRGWRGETYAVRAEGGGDAKFHIERAAARFFGLTSSASHLNGFVLHNGIPAIWIARRAAAKATDPGMLDNLVAGGVPSTEDAWQTLLRECGEEAGIPHDLAARSRPAGALRVCRDVPEGLNSEVLHVYDLELPPEFAPRNMDGEVSEFQSLDAPAMLRQIDRGEWTVAAALVAVDFALRRGTLPDESGEIRAAIEACRGPTPI